MTWVRLSDVVDDQPVAGEPASRHDPKACHECICVPKFRMVLVALFLIGVTTCVESSKRNDLTERVKKLEER